MFWHDMRLSELAQQLSTDTAVGISEAEVRRRLRANGANTAVNRIKPPASLSEVMLYPAALLLLAGAVVMPITGEGDWVSTAVLFLIAAFALFYRVVRARKMNAIISRVNRRTVGRAVVIRDGKRAEISASRLVAGDLMVINSGDYIWADARLVTSDGLACDERALFGPASVHVRKNSLSPVRGDDPPEERANMVYCGSSVISGNAVAIVVEVGQKTRYAAMAARSPSTPEPKSRLDSSIRGRVFVAAAFAMLFALVPVVLPYIGNYAVAVGSALALAGTALLFDSQLSAKYAECRSAGKLLDDSIVVKDIRTFEKMADVSVVCTEIDGLFRTKTPSVTGIWTPVCSSAEFDPKNEEQLAVLRLAALCMGTRSDGEKIVSSSIPATVRAAVTRAAAEIKDEENRFVCRRILAADEGMLARSISVAGVEYAVICGDAGRLLLRCSEVAQGAYRAIDTLSSDGSTVTAAAIKRIDADFDDNVMKTDGFLLAGLIAVKALPDSGAVDCVKRLESFMITPVLLTSGDANSAEAYAAETGMLAKGESAVEAALIEGASDDELHSILLKHTVFCGLSLKLKRRIVKAYRSMGETVACIADDTSLANLADVVFAPADACGAVCQAAHVLLTDRPSDSFVAAQLEARALLSNIKAAADTGLCFSIGAPLAAVASMTAGIQFARAPFVALAVMCLNMLIADACLYQPLRRKAQKNSCAIIPPTCGKSEKMLCLILTVLLAGAAIGSALLDVVFPVYYSFTALVAGGCFLGLATASGGSVFGSGIFKNKRLLAGFAAGLVIAFLGGAILSGTFVVLPLISLGLGAAVLPLAELGRVFSETAGKEKEE